METKIKAASQLAVGERSPLVKWLGLKEQRGAPEAISWEARSAAFLSYAAPVGAALARLVAPEQFWPQVMLICAAPVAVYLDKTWSRQRETEAKEHRTDQEGFFRSYAECLKTAIETAQTSGELHSEELLSAQQAVLRLVCNIVESFLGKPDGLKINASLMRDEPLGNWSQGSQLKDVQFASSTRNLDAYRCVLHLTVWATPPNDEPHIALPVAKNADILLFGAPKALVHGQMEYVTDTQNAAVLEELVSRQDDEVRAAITNYLQRKKDDFVSFISVPLRCGDDVLGVLNVQSNYPEILGHGESYRNDMDYCLLPLCSLLGILIARQNGQESATSGTERASE